MVILKEDYTAVKLTMIRPFDAHLHLRDGDMMKSVVGFTAKRFGGAIVMPNLVPPIKTVAGAQGYLQRILGVLDGHDFKPFMTLYLTDTTSPEEIIRASKSRSVVAVKWYPRGSTTNADSGVTDIENVYDVLNIMEGVNMPLLVHGEVTDPAVDVFDREKVFIDTVLEPLIQKFPRLKISLEHITTKEGVAFVESSPPNVVATITAHHLLLNRNGLFRGGICPHHYCLPVLKREEHRLALIKAATSGDPKFFLGTDSAPHARYKKETTCGCAGIFTAHAGIELYAEIFEKAGALDNLERFASLNARGFYELPVCPACTITLIREPWDVPALYPFHFAAQGRGIETNDGIVPLCAGETINWKMEPL